MSGSLYMVRCSPVFSMRLVFLNLSPFLLLSPPGPARGVRGPGGGIRHPHPDLPTVRAGSLFYRLQGRLAQKGLLS